MTQGGMTMLGLKVLRQIVGLVWIGVFILAILLLVNGQWVALIIAIVAWFVIAAIFIALHTALQRSEIKAFEALLRKMAVAVEAGMWKVALQYSQQAVGLMRASANRDKAGSKPGNGTDMIGPLGAALVGNGALLGANGQFDEAVRALDEGVSILNKFLETQPELHQQLVVANALREPGATIEDFRYAAELFHSFV